MGSPASLFLWISPLDWWDPWLAVAGWRTDAFSTMECQGAARSPICREGWGLQPLPASLVGPGQVWGQGQGWLPNKIPVPKVLGWAVLPHSRGICIPQRIFLIRDLTTALPPTPTQPRASKLCPPSVTALWGHRGGTSTALRRGQDPAPSPSVGLSWEERLELLLPLGIVSLLRLVLRGLRALVWVWDPPERGMCCHLPPQPRGDVPAWWPCANVRPGTSRRVWFDPGAAHEVRAGHNGHVCATATLPVP